MPDLRERRAPPGHGRPARKGLHLGGSKDTACKRSVFDLCSRHAKKQDWAEFVPAMRGRIMRFEIVDEDEWEQRLNAMLAA